MNFSKRIIFDNYYSRKDDSIVVTYNFEKGFSAINEAWNEVKNQKQNPEAFNYIYFNNQIYAVSIETTKKEIVIAKDFSWYWNKDKFMKFSNTDNKKDVPYKIEKPKISGYWMHTIYDDLAFFNEEPIKIVFGKSKAKSFAFNSIILLGIVMFETMVPVFQLNALDIYFIEYIPSRCMYWKQGIKKINPFSNMKEVQKGEYPYEQYVKEGTVSEEQNSVFEMDVRSKTEGHEYYFVGGFLPDDFLLNVFSKSVSM